MQSGDAAMYMVATFDVCGNQNMECVYQLTDVLINEIRTENFHINKGVSRKDVLFAELFNDEIFY